MDGLRLSFEQELRKEAIKLVLYEEETLTDALKSVRKDAVVKERFFTGPLALEAATGGGSRCRR